jgi:hypothetical protein
MLNDDWVAGFLRRHVAMAVVVVLEGCQPRVWASDPKTTGDTPRVTKATTQPISGVAYCKGGNRALACVLGANCRVTEAGCQVCECLTAGSP